MRPLEILNTNGGKRLLFYRLIHQGYLTENGSVNLDRVQLIMSDLGVVEDEIFKKRHQTELHFKSRDKFRRQQAKRFKKDPKPARILDGQYAPMVRIIPL